MRLIVAVAACCFALQSENIFGGMFTQGVALGCYVPTLKAEEENANLSQQQCPVRDKSLPHSKLCTLHFALCILHSALDLFSVFHAEVIEQSRKRVAVAFLEDGHHLAIDDGAFGGAD